MADMDTVVVRDRDNEYIHATLGPKGDELSRIELLRIAATVMKQMDNSKGDSEFNENFREIDLSF